MARKVCTICNNRPAATGAKRTEAGMPSGMEYCVPCFEEANWENTHSDGSHEGFEELTVRNSSFRTKKDLEAWKAEKREETAQCWICHPELNEAQREYTPREGTSRAGIVIHVSIRADGTTKAAETSAQLEATGKQFGFKVVKPSKANGQTTTLKAGSEAISFELRWDVRGRFVGGTVDTGKGPRKVRNVAEALRIAS